MRNHCARKCIETMRRSLLLPSLFLPSTFLCTPHGLADISQFRGPDGNGILGDDLPTQWGEGNKIAWSTAIPGGGWSSPVVAGKQIFLTTAVSSDNSKPKGFGEGVQSMGDFYRSKAPDQPYSFEVICLNAENGAQLWKQPIVTRVPPHKIHPSNSYATESPITDGTHVYAYFAAVGVLACLDLNGEERWRRELGAYKTGNDFGTGSSLAFLDDSLFVQCDNEEKSFVVALDGQSGEEVWRDDRTSGTSWSSPIVWKNSVRTELVVCGSDGVTGYDPATGEVFWKLVGDRGAYSATPTFDSERLYLGKSSRTSRGPLVAIKAGAIGELTLDSGADEGLAWLSDTSAPGMCSPVVVGGYVYVLSRGVLSCHDSKTGERVYRERLQNASSVTASLLAAGDKIYAVNEDGNTSVVKAGKEFEFVTSNSIDGLFWSTPAIADSALLIRGAAKLHCIRND